MAITYKVSGQTLENGTPSANLIIVYKADRGEPASMGQELGRAYAGADGLFEVTWQDWGREVFVVGADPTSFAKYDAKIFDWVYGGAAGYDPYFDSVVSLMHMEGSDGAQIVLDEVPENTLVVWGETNTSITQAKWGGTALRFDGDKDWITLPYRVEFDIQYKNWCVEMWVWLDAVSGHQTFFDSRSESDGDTYCPILFRSNNALLELYVGQTTGTSWKGNNSAGTLTAQQWHHVAASADTGIYRIFIDGIEVDSFIEGTPMMTHVRDIDIGCRNLFTNPMAGYMDDLRWTIGASRYVGDFTPPQQQFYGNVDPYWDDVAALLHMEGADGGTVFTDQKGNTCTAQASAKTETAEKKFGVSSLRCDGSSDRLQIDYNATFLLGSKDFTIECWYYPISLTSTDTIWANRINAQYGQFLLHINSAGTLYTYFQKATTTWMSSISVSGAVSAGVWQHIAVTRRGDSFKTFVNGLQVAGFTDSSPVISPVLNNIYLGAESQGTNAGNVYIDDFRLTVGTSRYNSNFPAPLRAFPDA